MLEQVFHTELENSGIHAGGGDLTERRSQLHQARSRRSERIIELRVVEGVEELGTEDQGLSLRNPRRLHDGDVPVELAGAQNDTDTRVAISGSVAVDAPGWSGAERRVIEVAGAAAIATQTLT